MKNAIPVPRFRISPKARRWLLTAHIVTSVGLLGDSAGFMAVTIRASSTEDATLAASSYELLEMFSIVFGIPLSIASLSTGIALGLSSRWGVFRYPWTVIKLGLNVSVMVVGAAVIGPGVQAMQNGEGGAEAALIAGSGYDVFALTVATGLGVFNRAALGGARSEERTPRRPPQV